MGQYIEAGAHGPDEHYHKYHVIKSDRVWNNDVGGDSNHGARGFFMQDEIAHQEFTVLLRPAANDHAARLALRYYADLIEDAYPQFAEDIRANMDKLDSEDVVAEAPEPEEPEHVPNEEDPEDD